MIEDYPTASDARNDARQYATPLDQLINADDVDPNADSWEEVDPETLERELWETTEILISQHDEPKWLVKDHAFRLWYDGMRRLPRDVLADVSDHELVHVYNVQPNDMDKYEWFDIAHRVFEDPNVRIPRDCIEKAREVVQRGLFEGSKPE